MVSESILIEARRWLKTPWQHNQKLLGQGVDCVRFIEAVFKDSLGYEIGDITCYAKMPEGDQLLIFLQGIDDLEQIPLYDKQPGDLLLFRLGKIPFHLGICNGNGMIHADTHHGVIELDNLGRWERRLVAVFRVTSQLNR